MTYTVHLFVYHADQSADMPNKWTWYVRIRPLLQKKKNVSRAYNHLDHKYPTPPHLY